ncbi:MAG: hypothetical protein [Circular genetic element sp.]|nr:MAG: hypothetical protein [Circular genetic element sp.]
MQNKLYYSTDTNQAAGVNLIQKGYFNIARDLSRVNSKNEEVTTRDGHVYGYMCQIKMQATASTSLIFSVAPNSWKLRNSFRKFHAYRDMMFDNAGVEGEEMGRYGKTIRPLLDINHKGNNDDTLVPISTLSNSTATSPGEELYFNNGEWTYTKLATTPIFGEGPRPTTTQEGWADAFSLHICEENVADIPPSDSASGSYSSVGMIHSYNLDRMEVVTPTSSEVLASPTNPLAALRATGNQAAGEVLDIAIDQELETPPYDIADDGPSIAKVVDNISAVQSTGGTVSFTTFLPAGLAAFYLSQKTAATFFEVTVLGKVLCKDMA